MLRLYRMTLSMPMTMINDCEGSYYDSINKVLIKKLTNKLESAFNDFYTNSRRTRTLFRPHVNADWVVFNVAAIS